MDFYEVIAKRRSFRVYRPDAVPQEALERMMKAVELAPSACNRQPYKFLIVTSPEVKAAICKACPQRMLPGAPAIVVALGSVQQAWQRPGGESILGVDIGIAMEHLVLAASAEGLGTCWVCAYDMDKVNEAVNAPAGFCAVAISPLGYAAGEASPLQRKPAGEIFEMVK